MRLMLGVILLIVSSSVAVGQEIEMRRPSPEQLEAFRKLFPESDANHDGTLSMQEAMAYWRAKASGRSGSAPASGMPAPTQRNVRYGLYEADVLDLWTAPSNAPAPLVVYIHGGGFVSGDKTKISPALVASCRESGAAFASINYRFRQEAPVQDILRDAARAIQFLRCHAAEYGIDPTRIACMGGSAGAGTSLWLAAHDDLADPASADPVLRQSSRVAAAACVNTQATYDITQWDRIVGPFRDEWKSGPDEEVLFYHFANRDELTSEKGKRVLADCDMLRWLSKDDPPIFVACAFSDAEPTQRNQYVHHPRHAKAVKARCDEVGVPCEYKQGGASGDRAALQFLLDHVAAPRR